jgi:hypothetical protein
VPSTKRFIRSPAAAESHYGVNHSRRVFTQPGSILPTDSAALTSACGSRPEVASGDTECGRRWPTWSHLFGEARSLRSQVPAMLGGAMRLKSTITCPKCGYRSIEIMPTDACQIIYDCQGCGTVLKPLSGDCCVFCSYGDTPCPPVQEARETGGAAKCCGAA